ncbi:MAG TPA: hypothetical protein VGV07_22140 [Devosia sp.]|jgi:hypothetical protein|uniref:hypothetical protein n=1 Tax=Devosia sp. TaxID=1871048 RepID=UPI002DDCD0A0|nr:hypothetical protein [Devosia sp.]HEV2517968.1 hypothetical protein [Devosia sp.]
MTSYLIARGPWPFDAETIRHALGLKTHALDLLITAGIASICTMSVRPVTSEVWDVTIDEDPARFGVPLSVSAPRASSSDRRLVRRVEYVADDIAVAKARGRVERWCRNQHDIALALLAEPAGQGEAGAALAEVA